MGDAGKMLDAIESEISSLPADQQSTWAAQLARTIAYAIDHLPAGIDPAKLARLSQELRATMGVLKGDASKGGMTLDDIAKALSIPVRHTP
jgi:hypothetical protein